MKVKFKYTFHDIRGMVAVRPGQTILSKVASYAVSLTLILFPFVAFWVFNTPNKTYWEVYSQLFAVSIFGLGLFPPTNAAIQAWIILKNQSKTLKGELSFEVTSEGISIENQDGKSFTKWSAFDFGRETDSLICLYRQKIGFAFPKRALKEVQLDELRSLIRSNSTIPM